MKIKKTLLSAAIVAAVGTFAAGANAAVVTAPTGWSEAQSISGSDTNWWGAIVGSVIDSEKHTASDIDTDTIKINAGAMVQAGVFGYIERFGTAYDTGVAVDSNGTYSSGLVRYARLWNAGTLIEPTEVPRKAGGTIAQVSGIYWLKEIYNQGTIDVGYVRMSNDSSAKGDSYDGTEATWVRPELLNTGSFKAKELVMEKGGLVANDGTIEIGNLYLGTTSTLSQQKLLALDTLAMEAGGGEFNNAGTVNVTGKFVNYFTIVDTGAAAEWNVDVWENHADATLNKAAIGTSLTNVAGVNFKVANALTAALIDNSGTVEVGTGSAITTLNNLTGATFKTTGTSAALGTVTNAGTMTLAGGDVMTSLNNTSTVTDAGALTVNGLLKNTGTVSVTGLAKVTGDIQNSGNFTAGSANINTLTNTATGEKAFTVNGALTASGLVTNSGKLNAQTAAFDSGLTNQTGGLITLTGDSSVTGATSNAGTITMETGNLSLGALDNDGTITLTAGKLTAGAVDNSEDINVANAEFASLNMSDAASTLDVDGLLKITGTTGTTLTNLGTITAGSLDVKVVNNQGSLTTDTATASTLGNVTNAGTIEFAGDATLASLSQTGGSLTGHGNVTLKGASTVAGNLTVDAGKTLNTTGLFTNNGTVNVGMLVAQAVKNTASLTTGGTSTTGAFENTATGKVTLGGQTTFASLTNAEGGKVDGAQNVIVTGALDNDGLIGTVTALTSLTAGSADNAGTIKAGAATFGADTAPAETVILANSGTLDVSGALTAYGTTNNTGSIKAGSATFNVLNNTGATASIVLTNGLTVNGLATNEKTITAATAAFKGGFANKAAGVITLTGDSSVTGTTTNDGSISMATGNLTLGSLTNKGTVALTAGKLSATGATINENDITAANFALSALTNKAGAEVTETGTSTYTSSFGAVTNAGTITLAHTTTFASLVNNIDAANGAIVGAAGLTVSDTMNNAGTIGADATRLTSLTVNGAAENTGSIFADAVTFGDTFKNNAGTLTVTNALSATGLLTNKAVIAAKSATFSGGLANQAGGQITLAADSEVVGDTTNAGTITMETGNLELEGLDNDGTITLTAGKLTAGVVDNSKDISVANAEFASLDMSAAVSTLDVGGLLKITGAGTTLTNLGTITAGSLEVKDVNNKAGASLKTDTATASTLGNVTNAGTIEFAGDATLASLSQTGGSLTGHGNVTLQGASTVAGNLTVDSGKTLNTTGLFTNNGTVNVGMLVAEAVNNTASLTTGGTSSTGAFENTAAGSVTLGGQTTFASLTNAEGGTVDGAQAVTVTGALSNAGSIGSLTALTSLTAGSLSNEGTGTIKAGTAAFGSESSLDDADVLVNGGTINLTGALVAYGTTTNTGDITADSATFKILNNSSGSIVLTNNLTVNGLATNGNELKAKSALFKGGLTNESGVITLSEDSEVQGATTNAGTISMATGNLTLDSLENSGTITVTAGKLTASGDIQNTGSVTAGSADIATLTNAASKTFKVTNLMQASGAVDNSGTISAGSFALAGVTNKSGASITETGTGTSSFGAVTNAGTITLTHDTSFASLVNNIDAANGAIKGAATLTISGTMNNAGTIGTDAERLTSLTVNGAAQNTGSVYAAAATFGNTLGNESVLTVSNALDVTGLLTNSGTVKAGTAVLTGGLTNTGSVETTGTLSIAGKLDNAEGKTITAGGLLTLSGADSVNAGTITADAAGLKLANTLTNTGAINAAAGLTVATGGVLTHNGGTLTTNVLDIQAGGKVVNSVATGETATIASLKGAGTLENSAALKLGSIDTANTAGLVYNQTAGSLTVADDSWFQGATLNISGGTLERLGVDANTLGTNTVNISGSEAGSYTDQTQIDADWKTGKTYVHVGLLDSNATVVLGAGGILEADDIQFTGEQKTLTLKGGALATGLSTMFDTVSETVYKVSDGTGTTLNTKVIGAANVGGLNADFMNHINYAAEGGALVVTDEAVSLTAIASASTALKTAAVNAGASAENFSVVYTGLAADGAAGSTNFYHNTFNRLDEEQRALGVSDFRTPGVVFSTMAYVNKASKDVAARTNLVIGTGPDDDDTFYMNQSIGFRKVKDTENVTVAAGKHFVLTGGTPTEAEGSAVELVNSATGALTVTGEGAQFDLGSQGVEGKGHIGKVTVADGAVFKAVKGEYSATTVELNSGAMSVAGAADLTVGTLTNAAGTTLTNLGKLTVTGDATLNTTLSNQKELVMNGVTTVATAFTNEANASATFNKLSFGSDGGLNKQGGLVKVTDGLTVGGAIQGSKMFTNAGRLELAGTTHQIDGQLKIEARQKNGSDWTQNGTMVAAGTMKVTNNGALANFGDARIEKLDAQGLVLLGEGSLIYTDEYKGNYANMLVAAKDSVILAKKFKMNGILSMQDNVTTVVGDIAVAEEITGEDGNPALVGRVDSLLNGEVLSMSLVSPLERVSVMSLRAMLLEEEAEGAISTQGRTVDVDYAGPFGNDAPGGVIGTGGGSASGINENRTVNLANDLTVTYGGLFKGYDNFYVAAGKTLTIQDGGEADFRDTSLDGVIRESNLVMKGATVVEQGGKLFTSNLVLADTGSAVVKGDATGDLLTVTDSGLFKVQGGSAVYAGGNLQQGSVVVESGYLGFGLEKTAAAGTAKPAVLGLSNSGVIAVNDATIQVGTLDDGMTLANGDVWFGADSAFVISTVDSAFAEPYLKGNGTGTLYVKEGSELLVTGAFLGRQYIMTTDLLNGMDVNAWADQYVKNMTGTEGLQMSVSVEGDKIVLDVIGGGETPTDPTPGEGEGGDEPTDPTPGEGEGGDTPSEGGDTPSEGGDTPSEGGDTPSEGGDTPSEGGDTPSEGGDTPSEGGDTPSEGGDTPSEGGNDPVNPPSGGEGEGSGEGAGEVPDYVGSMGYTKIAAKNIVNKLLAEAQSHQDDKLTQLIRPLFAFTRDAEEFDPTPVINGLFGLATVSGMDAYVFDQQDAFMSRIEKRVSASGLDASGDIGGLWVDVVGSKTKADKLGIGVLKGGYDADSYGIVMGGDTVLADGTTVGGAFTYVNGDIDSEGIFSATNTDSKFYGIAAYAAKQFGTVNVIGQAGWTRAEGDVSQTLVERLNYEQATTNLKSDSFHFGLRAELGINAAGIDLTPYAGIRYVYTDRKGYDVKVSGESVLKGESESTSIFQIPVGVSVSKTFGLANGWSVKPFADIGVTAQFGDTDSTTKITTKYYGSDTIGYDVTGDVVGKAAFGVRAESKSTSFGLSYQGAYGDSGKQSHGVNANFTWKF